MKSAYLEWEERWKNEMEFWFSPMGKELQRCLVAQGYEDVLMDKLALCFGSYWTVAGIINNLRREVK